MRFESVSVMFAFATGLVAAVPSRANVATVHAPVKRDTGEGTVYLQGGGYGSCGNINPDSALIGALSNTFMNNQSPSPYCGRSISVTNIGSDDGVGGAGNSVTITVADTCPSCDAGHIDLSVGAWNALTNSAPYGTIEIDWEFL